jgi:hypothetical protein
MDEQAHSAATEHMPMFITAPGSTDVLMVVMAVVLAVSVIAFGILFLRLHTLPERIAHKGHKIQFEIVAILGLIALFTHMHIFWIIGLLLAFIDIPDFGGFLGRIAGSVEQMAGVRLETGAEPDHLPPDAVAGAISHAHAAEGDIPDHHGDDATPAPKKPPRIAASRKEFGHA